MNGNETGFSLVEICVTLGILGTVLAMAGSIVYSGQGTYDTTTRGAEIDSRCNRVIERVSNALIGIDPGIMFPDPDEDGASQIDFQVATGMAGGNVGWSSLTRLGFEYEAGEIDDGIDNNGDGLVDEGRVVLTRDVGGADQVRVVLCRGVAEFLDGETLNGDDDNGNLMDDERGFCLQRIDSRLVVRMTLLEQDEEDGVVARTVETSIRMRN